MEPTKQRAKALAKFVRFHAVSFNHSLYRGLRYIEVHYICVPQYNCSLKFVEKTNYKAEICEFFATLESNEALNVKGAVSRLIYGVFSAR